MSISSGALYFHGLFIQTTNVWWILLKNWLAATHMSSSTPYNRLASQISTKPTKYLLFVCKDHGRTQIFLKLKSDF